jgi:hypothetical protein
MILHSNMFGAWDHFNGGGAGDGPITVLKDCGLDNQDCDARELLGGDNLHKESSQRKQLL